MGGYSIIGPLSIALVLFFEADAYGANPCETVVADRLDRLNIELGDVRGITYARNIRSRRNNGRVVGYEAWVRFQSCKGALVIDMDRHCRVKQVYTRYECRVPGVPSF